MKKLFIVALQLFFAVPVALYAASWKPMPSVYRGPRISQALMDLYDAAAKMSFAEREEHYEIVGAQIASLKDLIAKKEAQGASQQEINTLKAQLSPLEIYHRNYRAEEEGRPARMN